MNKLSGRDFKLHVCREEREVEQEYAKFYRGIFHVLISNFQPITFIPHFLKNKNNWPPLLPENVDLVESHDQARLFTAALADYAVTSDAELAGEEELIPLPAMSGRDQQMARIFYVTPEQFADFTQELALIEKQTFWVNEYVMLSQVQHFNCIQFILSKIIQPRFRRRPFERLKLAA